MVADTTGTPLAGKTINFTLGSASYGTLSAANASTDANGRAAVTYTAPATSGSYNIVASSAYGSVSVTAVVGGSASAIGLLISGTDSTGSVGTCYGPFLITSVNNENTATNVSANKTVNLSLNGSGIFYSDAGCTSAITTRTISSGNSSTAFYFNGDTVGFQAFYATASGLGNSNYPFIISAGAPASISVAGTGTLTAGACSTAITATLKDSGSNTAKATSSTTINLSGEGSGTFYSDAACTSSITSRTIATNASTATFYFKDTTTESLTLTAAGTSLTSGTLSMIVASSGISGSIAAVSSSNFTMAVSANSTITMLVSDSSGAPLSGKTVNFSLGSASYGALSAASATTDANGRASITYTSPANNGSYNIVATSAYGSASVTATVGSVTSNYPAVTFAGLTSTAAMNDTSVRVYFNRPTGGSGFFTYRVYRDNSYGTPFKTFGTFDPVDSVNGTYFEITGLTASTAYTLTLRAYDMIQGTEDSNVVTSTATTTAAMTTFPGASSISNITTSSARINWTHIADAVSYKIYNMTSGTAVLAGIVSAPTANFTIPSLAASTNYIFRVRYVNASNVEDSNATNQSFTTSSPITFAGLTSISNVTGTTMQLNWSHVAGAITYRIDNVTSGTPVTLATTTAPINYKVVTGLTQGTTYIFRVRAIDTYGTEDTNSVQVTQATTSVSITHNGWTDAYSVGKKVSYDGSTITAASQRLEWNEMTPSAGSISSYNLYRSTSPSGTWTQVNGSAISTNSGNPVSYTVDASALTASIAYYYQVRAVVSGSEITPTATAPTDHTTIRMILPPNNMALVHRWIANEEMCSQIGRGIANNGADFGNHYRCLYNGIGSTQDTSNNNWYYDVGYDMLFDQFELGCNVSMSACPSHTDGTTTTTACMGFFNGSNPAWAASNGSVGYNRYIDSSYYHTCYYRVGGNWAKTPDLSATELSPVSSGGNGYGGSFASNAAYLPPLANFSQQQVQSICQNFSVSISDNGSSINSSKRLPRRKEVILAKAWPKSYSAANMYNVSAGVHPTGCNKNGINNNLDVNDDYYPSSSGVWWYLGAARTGSNVTSACKSRYGIQDLIGNASEWTSDQISCTGTSCTHDVNNTIDINSKLDWKGKDGVYLNYQNAVNKFAEYAASDEWFTSGNFAYFNPIQGIPLECSGTYCTSGTDDNILVTGRSSGASIVNYFNFQESKTIDFSSTVSGTAGVRALMHDYYYNAANFLGRFTIRYRTNNFNDASLYTGGRCMAPVSY
jgi:hypothetical protein